MDIVIVGGFFGSGKTTLLSLLAEAFNEEGKKIAIIENEVAPAGIDGAYLKRQGLVVREIYAGCVCCELKGNLLSTIDLLEHEISPDLIILEPSGLACPSQILETIQSNHGNIDQKRYLLLLDADRLKGLSLGAVPVLSDGIEYCDVVVINKMDLISRNEMDALIASVKNVNPHASVIPISAKNRINTQLLLDLLRSEERQAGKTAPHAARPFNLRKAAVYSQEMGFTVDPPVPGTQVRDAFACILSGLASDLKEQQASMIGHLKAIAVLNNETHLISSVTSFENAPETAGEPPSLVASLTIKINAIAYGLAEEKLSYLAELRLRRCASSLTSGTS